MEENNCVTQFSHNPDGDEEEIESDNKPELSLPQSEVPKSEIPKPHRYGWMRRMVGR